MKSLSHWVLLKQNKGCHVLLFRDYTFGIWDKKGVLFIEVSSFQGLIRGVLPKSQSNIGGILCRDFTKRVSLPKNSNGQIVMDSHLRVLGDPSGRVHALGDCAQVEGHMLPCTGE